MGPLLLISAAAAQVTTAPELRLPRLKVRRRRLVAARLPTSTFREVWVTQPIPIWDLAAIPAQSSAASRSAVFTLASASGRRPSFRRTRGTPFTQNSWDLGSRRTSARAMMPGSPRSSVSSETSTFPMTRVASSTPASTASPACPCHRGRCCRPSCSRRVEISSRPPASNIGRPAISALR